MPDLPVAVTLNRAGPLPLHLQLAAHLREAALGGQLPPGTLLPGTRTLARELGVTRGVVEAAYALLAADGTLQGEVGRGTRVSRGVQRTAQAATPSPAWFTPRDSSPGLLSDERPGIHFRTGVTSAAMLSAQAWKRAWAYAARQPVGGDYADAAGLPELRSAVCAFVGRSRGLPAAPDTLLLTAGTLQSLGLLARAVLPAGATILFENPGYRSGRAVLEGAGHRLVPLPVDEDGPVVHDLPPAHAVYVTPSHQFPLGHRLSLPRRLALLAWAERQGALILEDDYDGEFRYDVPPLPPLASLDTAGRVVYLGTFSKVLSPALRTAFVVAAPALVAALSHERARTDGGHAPALQHALRHLLTSGEMDRHVRRARRWHAQVREGLRAELAPLAPFATLRGIEAGLHVCLHLAPPLDAEDVAQELARRGVYAETLRTFTFAGTPQNALVLGYGGLTIKETREGARVIREVIARKSKMLSPFQNGPD